MKKSRKGKKGTFSDLGLPVAKKYLVPVSRRPVILVGALAIALAALYVAGDYFLRDAAFLSNGPLSSNHATVEDDCGACHDAFAAVASEKCSVCHEKHGDRLGVYTWAAHYVYRSDDFSCVVSSADETSCAACHLEHRGREAAITRVADARCRTCHELASFNDGHPAFERAAAEDRAGLVFPHVRHVRELMKRGELVDVEKACLYCHNARPDGKGFEPISFDDHCDPCHLTAAERTPPLPVAGADPTAPGVLTLAELRAARRPGSEWTLFMSPAELRERGGEVTKSPLYHEDPWILENLRLLRRKLYPDAGLADLLRASAEVPPEALPALYEEAIATLEAYALGLRARPEPEVRQELERIGSLLDELKRRLRDPLTPLDETEFLLALEGRRAGLADDEAAAIEALADDLTEVCRRCHLVADLTIARVQKDQRVLRRAEFDHRAHILQRRCLDCHTAIPILDHLDPQAALPGADVDNAAIQDLPAIDACRECHRPGLASNRCVTCHFFHPNKSRRSEMLLYLDVSTAAANGDGASNDGE